jgi:hypothetical protein
MVILDLPCFSTSTFLTVCIRSTFHDIPETLLNILINQSITVYETTSTYTLY